MRGKEKPRSTLTPEMRLQLTPDQAAEIIPHLRTGFALLGRIIREPYTGGNAETCGTLQIELGSVPESSLPALRDAIRTATAPAPAKRKAKR